MHHRPRHLAAPLRTFLLALCAIVTVVVAMVLAPSPAFAKTGTYVYDTMDLLDSSEFEELEKKGKEYAETYDMGVYLLTCADMGSYDPSPSERDQYAIDFFNEKDLGVGAGRRGIIFVIAAVSRDYVTVKHIDSGDPDPFSYDCVDDLEDTVTDYLHDDDWGGGARAYYKTIGNQLEYFAQNGSPWEAPDPFGLMLKVAFSVGLPALVAWFVITSEKNAMKTARMQENANAYEGEGLRLDISRDEFLRRTRNVVPKPKNNSSGSGGGWHSSGGGFSGSGGGKF